ncbi:transketolase C-terminal domain-containing protein [Actinophytocola sp.]|uniref:transketolase C-terminal domain-containing protein n=1 Tax=Actinophytocola sp. TaxID=1872138 RepID=UPI003899EF56
MRGRHAARRRHHDRRDRPRRAAFRRGAERLARRGVGATVVDVRTVAPLDLAGIAEAPATTGTVLVVDEAPAPCSAASEIVARLLMTEAVRPAGIRQLNALPVPALFSPVLQREVFPRPDAIERHAIALRDERS